jgi:4-amino-4-deoxy-L-arabinose transferase-like glycosyltransferase
MKKIFLIFSFFILYFFDIANPNALRQGTEGFYLMISKEMFIAKSYLTPLIYGQHHWSKPPLHFWFPMPLARLFGDNYLLAARLSISLLSLWLVFLISKWYQSELKRNWWECAVFLVSPIYFFKYSRIFMMEMPLALLTTLASLYFYSYITKHSKGMLLKASFFAAASSLVKGPVSLLLIYPPTFLFTIVKKKSLPRFLFFALLSLLLSSLWFVASYIEHGLVFFNYFFIRENVGKFLSKNYPITSVIQGLIIYSMPLIILVIPTWKKYKSNLLKNNHIFYLSITFIFFYFIWFLPKQKSHHYAVPAIPTLLMIISYHFFSLHKKVQDRWLGYLNSYMNLFIIFALLITLLVTALEPNLLIKLNSIYKAGFFFIIFLWFTPKLYFNNSLKVLKLTLPLILIWSFVVPIFYLPIIPARVVEKMHDIEDGKIYIDFRKPFFVEQSIGRAVTPTGLNRKSLNTYEKGSLVMAPSNKVELIRPESYKLIAHWSIWRRGIKFKEIIDMAKGGNIEKIKENYSLIKLK